MNPERSNGNEAMRTSLSFLKRVGETAIGIGVAFAALKIGESAFDFELSHPVEVGISSVMGSAPVNVRYARLANRNRPT